jgi:hypothetical protein
MCSSNNRFDEQEMHGHSVLLAAFFVESQPTARAVIDSNHRLEFQHRADTSKL